ncbi:hypothetical protein BP6252_09892 [Coleophoma cylindrospora]|uniref:Uncharacterized protein n=1 Tax=Coleophoma cylindrospora TaxID=1849047 RepID=A0A3D8QWW1_9HELO|nr:hypothetical protein BP6252_09892 [Coleophoma cylindrospora]
MPQETGLAIPNALPELKAREAAPEPAPLPQLQIPLPECSGIASSVSISVSQSVLASAISLSNVSISQAVAAVRSSAQLEIAAASMSAANVASSASDAVSSASSAELSAEQRASLAVASATGAINSASSSLLRSQASASAQSPANTASPEVTDSSPITVVSKSSTVSITQAAIGIVGASVASSVLSILVFWMVSRRRSQPLGLSRDSGATLDFKLDMDSPTFERTEDKSSKGTGFVLARQSSMPPRLSKEVRASTTESIPLGFDIDYPVQALLLPIVAADTRHKQQAMGDAAEPSFLKEKRASTIGTAH